MWTSADAQAFEDACCIPALAATVVAQLELAALSTLSTILFNFENAMVFATSEPLRPGPCPGPDAHIVI
jgi:hypothetical protein